MLPVISFDYDTMEYIVCASGLFNNTVCILEEEFSLFGDDGFGEVRTKPGLFDVTAVPVSWSNLKLLWLYSDLSD